MNDAVYAEDERLARRLPRRRSTPRRPKIEGLVIDGQDYCFVVFTVHQLEFLLHGDRAPDSNHADKYVPKEMILSWLNFPP